MNWQNSFVDFIQYEFLQLALIAVILLSITCGILSPLIIPKRLAFLGEGVAHSTLLGFSIALCFFDFSSPTMLLMITFVITLGLTLVLAYSMFKQKLPSDSLIGIFLSATLSLGIIIHFYFVQNKVDLSSFLFGNILLVTWFDIIGLILMTVFIFIMIIPFWNKWIFFLVDEEGAGIFGIHIKRYHISLIFILVVVIVMAVKIAGTLLVNTLLLIPGAFAYRLAKNMLQVLAYSIIFSVTSSLLGLYLANWWQTPPGSTLAFTQFCLFLLLLLRLQLKKRWGI